jgi:hypothetical protein
VAITDEKSPTGSELRRQLEGGGTTAGSSRAVRLDPFALPIRFRSGDAAADGQVRQVELCRERVILRRAVRGITMKLRMPVTAFHGVALRLTSAEEGAALAVVLHHADDALSVPLLTATDDREAVSTWKAWGRVLGLPLLVEDEGGYREIGSRLGKLHTGKVAQRRRRRSALKRRRPSILLRRRPGRSLEGAPVIRGAREIIARN